MKISGDQKTDDNGDDAKKFDFVVGRDAISEIFGDLAIKNHGETATGDDGDACKKPADAESPVHKLSIAQKIHQGWWIYLLRLVGICGLEPQTSSLSVTRSNQLSYIPRCEGGGAIGIQTLDLCLAKAAL